MEPLRGSGAQENGRHRLAVIARTLREHACARLAHVRLRGHRPASGFTLTELMLAVVLAAILVSIAVPMYSNYRYKAQVSQATVDIGMLQYMIDSYYTNHNSYPATLGDLGIDPAAAIDPWGFPYQYLDHALLKGKGSIRRDKSLNPLNTDYDLYSVGADGQSKPQITQKESLDDVIRAGNGSYVGLASQF
jgi:general secretion pathway protein G